MKRLMSKLTNVLVVLVCCAAAATANAQTADDLAAKGEAIANVDPLTAELRNRQPEGPARRGFDIGIAAAGGDTTPGPGKQRIHDSLPPDERAAFRTAVAFSLERKRNADLAAKGAAIAAADQSVAEARTLDKDVFYWLGFDIATGIFGDLALGALGNTATGPGSLKIRDSLSAAGQRGFNAAVKLHLNRRAPSTAATGRTSSTAVLDLNSPYNEVYSKNPNAAAAILVANLPFINGVQVRPDNRDVIISFTSTQKTPPLIEIGKVAPERDQQGILAFPAGSGSFSRFVPGQNGTYSLNLGTLGEQLDMGSRYHYIINVFNDNKNNAKRPREQVTGIFSTLPQTVKVIFTEITITPNLLLKYIDYVFRFDVNVPDEDKLKRLHDAWVLRNFGKEGEFQVPGRRELGTLGKPAKLEWGANPIQEEVVIENAPDALRMEVWGEVPNLTTRDRPWRYRNVARDGFDLSAYPGDRVSIPFSLTSEPLERRLDGREGILAFQIKGRIEVMRR